MLRRLLGHPLVSVAIVLVLFVPVVVAVVFMLRPQWYPTGDLAQAELHVRGFWSNPPLVGAAGRIQNSDGVQGSHPGPGLWLAAWPLYALLGSSSASMTISTAIVHLATASFALWLAWRRGGATFALVLGAGLAVVVRAGGAEVFTELWNPWMGLLPFLVFVLALWSWMEGDHWAAVVAVVAGSYSIQAHTGFIILVVGLLAGVTVFSTWRDHSTTAWTWLGIAAAAGVVVWVPPLVDQVRRDPGNISILLDSFGNPDRPYLGLATVAEIVGVQFNLFGPWLTGAARDSFDVLALVGLVGIVVLWSFAARSAWRRRATDELHLHALLIAAWVLAVVSITRIFGTYFEYTIRWAWLLAAMVVAASIWSLTRGAVADERGLRDGRPGAWFVAGAVAVLGAFTLIATVQFAGAEPTGFVDGEIVAGVLADSEGGLDRDDRYLVRWFDPSLLGATGFGLVLELERRGYDVGVDQPYSATVLPHRVRQEPDATSVLWLVLGESSIEQARTTPGMVELGEFDVRSPDDVARAHELRADIEAALEAAGQGDRVAWLDDQFGQIRVQLAESPPTPDAVLDDLRDYLDLREPAALFEAPPFTAVEL